MVNVVNVKDITVLTRSQTVFVIFNRRAFVEMGRGGPEDHRSLDLL